MDENLSNMPANYGDDEGHASSGNSLKDVPGCATLANGIFEVNVRAELQRVVNSPHFEASERNHRFLTYVVEETLAGRSHGSRHTVLPRWFTVAPTVSIPHSIRLSAWRPAKCGGP
jgi:hypothetical protein